ncbi:MAG TPA: adenosylcobalamin-dependent ribonucleoside-diphosphate reductase [Deltaproteobacteria bacterium]|nr:MAG: ribonucleoside-diphosphate reductase, adenosylcobalamin-dependent [Deltaproteobacteria bacterium GWA2_55_82]OGQ64112.1 MAG: ribonucleoside-diphosphate reductase, adenosylcobalamin-dependent [Deltaproteobacteria bacterium RIFCSPLOWO2_02_FULL_55_12]OIJ74564.1 MAG: ribonucleoside-diphosphate reductase, adenosylcobalamin-dependent [Deltaproteobacteria bacterium GWC2_55_46]HBG46497.1 adenosylcobalamin-dependent ribonucleoside-diphosphate reductase [Deltaproteobacteria bacterium]HCY10709.1 ad
MAVRLSPGALTVLERRYLKKDESGRVIETPEDMFRRVASNIAKAEPLFGNNGDEGGYEEAFCSLISALEFLPNSPTLMNAGRRLQQLAACFVLPVGDSLESIFDAVKDTAIIHQSGGGTGFSFSRLRPADDLVSSTGGLASGPVSFMRVFNATTEAIKQGGTRRGANMGILKVDHPDIMQFITVKEDPAEFTNFNLSVAVTDAFMKALEEGAEYELVNPRTGRPAGKVGADEVFGRIAECAWKSGEPGVLFIDRIESANPTPHIGRFEATNPCGEQPLLSYEPCNLGSINLGRMVREFGGRWVLDWEKLAATVSLAVRFLDNVIEMSRYPTAEIDAMAKANRKIGLGVMGFADLLVRLRIRYGSEESFALAEEVMRYISARAWGASRALARERGPFPNIKGSVFDKAGVEPVRNATVTTIAPTGTLSIIAGCSSGIEPFFSLSYIRQVLNGVRIPEVNPLVAEVAMEEGFYNESLIEHVSNGGDIKERDEVPERVKEIFVTAYEIPTVDHIRMQAAFQKHTDNAVSKTINLPPEATVADVREAYLAAWRLGCKGVTVYRSGTRAEQVLTCKSPLYC